MSTKRLSRRLDAFSFKSSLFDQFRQKTPLEGAKTAKTAQKHLKFAIFAKQLQKPLTWGFMRDI